MPGKGRCGILHPGRALRNAPLGAGGRAPGAATLGATEVRGRSAGVLVVPVRTVQYAKKRLSTLLAVTFGCIVLLVPVTPLRNAFPSEKYSLITLCF